MEIQSNDTIAEDDDFLDQKPDTYDPMLEGQPYDNFYGGDMSPPMEKQSDLLKQLTNFDPYVRDKVNGWLGLVWDEDKERFVQSRYIKPIMNQRAAQWCIDYLKTYARENNIITDIGRDEYNNIVADIIDVVWLNLGTRPEEFRIRNNGDALRVAVELQHAAELVLMGAGDGKYSKLLSTTTQRSESVQLGNQPMQAPMYPQPQMQEVKKAGMFTKIKSALFGAK